MKKSLALSYQAFGDESAPPLLVLHGLMGAGRNWYRLARRISDSRRVIVPDMRCHGASPDGPLDYPHMAADLEALLDSLELAHADVLGHSMGGKAAAWLALTRPGRVRRLVVADISPVTYPDRHSPLLETLNAVPLAEMASRHEVDAWLQTLIPDASVRQFAMQNLTRSNGRLAWGIDLERIQRSLPTVSGFPGTAGSSVIPFDNPSLFLAAEHSDYVLPAHHEGIYRLFPAASISVLPACGHWLHVDQPDSFLAAVSNFLV